MNCSYDEGENGVPPEQRIGSDSIPKLL